MILLRRLTYSDITIYYTIFGSNLIFPNSNRNIFESITELGGKIKYNQLGQMKEISCNFYYIILTTAFRSKNVHMVQSYVMLYLVHITLPRVRYVQMSDVDYCPCLKFEELCSGFQLCLNA